MANVNQSGSLIQIIGDLRNYLLKLTTGVKTISLTEVTKLARVEPMTVVAKDCVSLDYLPDILSSMLNIFVGYYLQAIALSSKIDNVKVIKILDRLNVDRDLNGQIFAMESKKDISNILESQYKYRLPFSNRIATEDSNSEDQSATFSQNKIVTELANLAVGKMVDVKIKTGDQELNIPVNVRLVPATIPMQSIIHILTLKQEDNTFIERFHAWRSGRISLINDLILCQDLIDEHKKALMKDEEGVYSEIIRRVNNSKKYGLLTSNPSLVSASNLFILSEESAKEVELKLGGKLSNARIRQKAFENTYAMIICVIDRDYERVTFYYRGIAQSTEISIAAIKASNSKNKGPDILDVFKSLSQGNAASF